MIKSLKIVPIKRFILMFLRLSTLKWKWQIGFSWQTRIRTIRIISSSLIHLYLFFQTADVKQRWRAGLLRSDVYFNAGISSGQHSLHACGLFFFLFPSAEIRCGGCRAAAAICRSAAVQPVPQSIGRRAIISQREWLSPAHYIIIISDPSPFTPTPE